MPHDQPYLQAEKKIEEEMLDNAYTGINTKMLIHFTCMREWFFFPKKGTLL